MKKRIFFAVFISLILFISLSLLRAESSVSPEDLQLQKAQKEIGNWEGKTNQKKEAKTTSDNSSQKTKKSSEKTDAKTDKNAKSKATAKNTDKKNVPKQEGDDFNKKNNKERVSFFWIFFKAIIVLLVLGFGLYYLLKFIAKKQGLQVMGREVVEVLTMVPISPGKYLQIVDVAGKVLLLGVSDAGINLLTEITSQEEIDKILLGKSKSVVEEKQNFMQLLFNQAKNRFQHFSHPDLKNSSANSEDDFQDLIAKQRERLEHLKNKEN